MEIKDAIDPWDPIDLDQEWRRWRMIVSVYSHACFYLACGGKTLETYLPQILDAIGVDRNHLIAVEALIEQKPHKLSEGGTIEEFERSLPDYNLGDVLLRRVGLETVRNHEAAVIPILVRGFNDVVNRSSNPENRTGHDWDQDLLERLHGKLTELEEQGKKLVFITWIDKDADNFDKAFISAATSQFKSSAPLYVLGPGDARSPLPFDELSRMAACKQVPPKIAPG